MDWSSFQGAAQQFASSARSAYDETVAEFRQKGVSGKLRESVSDVAEVAKDLSQDVQRGLDAAAAWIVGDDAEHPVGPAGAGAGASAAAAMGVAGAAGRAAPSSPPRPRRPERPARLEDLRKGQAVYRKGQPAEIVKVDYEVYPPSLVVKMLETGNEVGTTGDHVSLGEEDSLRCLSEGVRLCLVGVKSRPELNCARGTAREYRAEADRWNVELASGELISLRPRCLSVLLAPSPPAEADAAPPPSPAAAHIGGEAAESAAAEAGAEEERRPASPERRPPSPQPRAAAAGEQPPEPSPRPAAAAEGELPPRPPLGAAGSADAPGAAVSLRSAGGELPPRPPPEAAGSAGAPGAAPGAAAAPWWLAPEHAPAAGRPAAE